MTNSIRLHKIGNFEILLNNDLRHVIWLMVTLSYHQLAMPFPPPSLQPHPIILQH